MDIRFATLENRFYLVYDHVFHALMITWFTGYNLVSPFIATFMTLLICLLLPCALDTHNKRDLTSTPSCLLLRNHNRATSLQFKLSVSIVITHFQFDLREAYYISTQLKKLVSDTLYNQVTKKNH